MKTSGLIVFSLLWGASASAAIPEHKLDIWATEFRWVTPNKSTKLAIETEMKKHLSLSRAYDPDCLWAKECTANPDPKLTSELDAFADVMKKETDGAFDVQRERDGRKYRDYGGMVQGHVLEKLKTTDGEWAADFAGDIFVAKPFEKMVPLSVTDWSLEDMPFASVEMKSGWMLGSSLTSNISDPKTGKKLEKSDFKKIVLFARPEFNGARLDAWSTALMVGGKPLLEKLLAMKEHQGQWEYLYFDAEDKPFCSKNLKCKLYGMYRTIVAPW